MRPTLRITDWRLWASVGLVFMAASVLVCLLFVVPAANEATAKAGAAESAADAGRAAAVEVRKGNDAAACRSEFNGRIVDVRADLDDARAAHQQAIGDGLRAAFEDDKRSYVLAVARADEARTEISAGRLRSTAANDEYQALLAAQNADRAEFVKMCEAGPGG